MTAGPLKTRTRAFALAVVKLARSLPSDHATGALALQLLRSATSVAANYRAARRARTRREFIAKLGIVEEEADESAFWIELIADAGIVDKASVAALLTEANELTAMTVSSIRTARGHPLRALRSQFRA